MPTYLIVHGAVWKGGAHQATGTTVDLDEAEALKLDPSIRNGIGECLMLESKSIANRAGDKAKVEAVARVEKELAAKELAAKAEAEIANQLEEERKAEEKAKHGDKKHFFGKKP